MKPLSKEDVLDKLRERLKVCTCDDKILLLGFFSELLDCYEPKHTNIDDFLDVSELDDKAKEFMIRTCKECKYRKANESKPLDKCKQCGYDKGEIIDGYCHQCRMDKGLESEYLG